MSTYPCRQIEGGKVSTVRLYKSCSINTFLEECRKNPINFLRLMETYIISLEKQVLY